MTTQNLQPGDIVFFKWSGWTDDPTADPRFVNFSHLAGQAQMWGYEDRVFRPWHHCGVIDEDGLIVQFGQSPGQTGLSWDLGLGRGPFAVPAEQDFQALRTESDQVRNLLTERTKALFDRKTTYSVGALLGFAFATQRRLFVEGDGRTRLGHLAAGTYHLGLAAAIGERTNDAGAAPIHTCVSAVMSALRIASIAEPPIRTASLGADATKAGVLSPIFEQFLERVKQPGLAPITDDDAALTAPEIREGFGLDQKRVPGDFIKTTSDYLAFVRKQVGDRFRIGVDEIERIGQDYQLDDRATPPWLVSPAMLWDHLRANGFKPIDV